VPQKKKLSDTVILECCLFLQEDGVIVVDAEHIMTGDDLREHSDCRGGRKLTQRTND